MGLLWYYLRNFIRSGFKPVNPRVAKRWEFNTTMMYLFFAVASCGYSFYALVEVAKQGTLGDARVIDPIEYMKKFGTKDEFQVFEFDGKEMKKKVIMAEELDN